MAHISKKLALGFIRGFGGLFGFLKLFDGLAIKRHVRAVAQNAGCTSRCIAADNSSNLMKSRLAIRPYNSEFTIEARGTPECFLALLLEPFPVVGMDQCTPV